jgi:hypothetical protein
VSNRKIDFGTGRSWTAHAQDHWITFAGNPNFSDYLRVVFVAYGRHHANGHAVLNRGELAYYLVRKDGTLPTRDVAWRAVADAVELGYLAEGSRLLCLIVPAHDVQGGHGNPDARCRRDHTRRGGRTSATTADVPSRTSATTLDVPSRTSATTADVPCSAPLLSLYSPSHTPGITS